MMYRIAVLIGFLGLTLSFWLYSRLTIDDAFITWRYGKNLIEYGIWNYNPSSFDPTQAYTNPIFAILSILPAILKLDIVLFFKIFSVINLICFSIWYIQETKGSYLTLIFLLGMPATVTHAFGGLETFLYVSLIGALYVALDKKNKGWSIFLTLCLFLTRPESWLLAILVPAFFIINEDSKLIGNVLSSKKISFEIVKRYTDIKSFIIIGLALSIPLIVYLLINKAYFGYALPNTFYAKSKAAFSFNEFINFLFFSSPIFLLLLLGRLKIFLLIFTYSFVLALNYSMSNLAMNYSARFAFHIFIPIYIFLIYVSAIKKDFIKIKVEESKLFKLKSGNCIKLILMFFLLVFIKTSNTDSHLVSYYPRALDSYAALGKTLAEISERYKIKSFTIGDAGMAAYHSNLITLDNVGLGSSLVIQKGLTTELLDSYKPDLIAFYSQPNEIFQNENNQLAMIEWAHTNKLDYRCDVYWKSDYVLKLYSRVDAPELMKTCLESKLKNNQSNSVYLKDKKSIPPWLYWRE